MEPRATNLKVRMYFRPWKFLINVSLMVFVALNAPWYVTVAAILLATDIRPGGNPV